MANFYIDSLETIITAAQISYNDSGCYMPFHYGDWNSYDYHYGNAATDIVDANYIVKFPIDTWYDLECNVYVSNEYWYIDTEFRAVIRSGFNYNDTIFSVKYADFADNNFNINILGNELESAIFYIKSDYETSESSIYLPIDNEFWYDDIDFYLDIPVEYDAVYEETYFRVGFGNDEACDANMYFLFTGNRRYVTRIRFKERGKYGVIYYKLEYLIPESQVWQLFDVVDARINNEIAPYWSPIRNNPCYANIYRSGETIDIEVDGVWTTEVRMVIYSTEDPFNRTGTVEFGVFEDIITNYVDSVEVGWRNDPIQQEINDFTMVSSFYVGWWSEQDVVDSTSTYLVDDIKIYHVPEHNINEFNTINAVKIHFYPEYGDAAANYSVHIKDPYEDYGFYLDAWNRGYEDATSYIPVIYSGVIDATTFLRIPDFEDASIFIPTPGHYDATTYIGSWPPYEDASIFIPTPKFLDYSFDIRVYEFVDATTYLYISDYIDIYCIIAAYNEDSTSSDTYINILGHELESASIYLDTLPAAVEVADFLICTDKPYLDTYIDAPVRAIDIYDTTSDVYTCIAAISEEISGSFNIGKTVDSTACGSFNISSGIVYSEEISGSFNIRGVIDSHALSVTILGEKEAEALKSIGVLDGNIYRDEIT